MTFLVFNLGCCTLRLNVGENLLICLTNFCLKLRSLWHWSLILDKLDCMHSTSACPLCIRFDSELMPIHFSGHHSFFKIGNDKRTYFWQSPWLGNSPLKVRYPTIFKISIAPFGSVKTIGIRILAAGKLKLEDSWKILKWKILLIFWLP